MAARPTTEGQALLRDICKEPDNDGLRGIYADWLVDHGGDPGRAEFIHTQIALARIAPDDPRRAELAARESALLGEHEGVWRAELPDLPRIRWGRFHRGFIAEVTAATFSEFRRRAAAIFAAAPVQRLSLGRIQYVGSLASAPALSRVTSLSLRNVVLGTGGARTLAAATHLSNLAELSLAFSTVWRGALQELVESPTLGRLVTLRLTRCGLTARDLRMITGLPGLRRIRELDLSGNPFRGTGAEALIASECLGGLRALSLRDMDFRPRTRNRLRKRFPFVDLG